MSSRTRPNSHQNRDLYSPGVYTQPKAAPTGFTPLFSNVFELPAAKNKSRRRRPPKKCGPFPVISSRY
jgi:hypothetical protein